MTAGYTTTLKTISVAGYKSIEQMSLDLGSLNVLIGPNGAGKSNFVSFFNLLSEMAGDRLAYFVGNSGGADALLFYGPKTTRRLAGSLQFESPAETGTYAFQLAYSKSSTLIFESEKFDYKDQIVDDLQELDFGSGHSESHLRTLDDQANRPGDTLRRLLRHCRAFQFHDTSVTADVRRPVYVHDNRRLRHDAGNLAAVLYKLRETREAEYDQIIQTIRQIAPWFGDFVIQPLALNKENLQLDWQEKGSDLVFGPHQLSDGTLRAMALVTLLLQPAEDLPSVVVIDEPELGLHPHAIVILSALIKEAACDCQIILATQSTCLLDQFDTEDVIVIDREDRGSTFKRLERKELSEWLEDYSLSELWEKNVLGGGPV